MDNIYLEKVHKYSLEILEYIDSICEKNNINYSLDCGSLIGAVREKGFISWDDDLDISFTRDEYNRFLEAIKASELPSYIKIYNPEAESHFLDFNIRLYNTKEIVRNDDKSKTYFGGIWQYPLVDIYVYDNLPENMISKRLFIFRLQVLFGLAMSKRYKIIYKNYKLSNRIYIFFLSKIGKLFTNRFICDIYKKASTSCKNSNLLYCTSWAPEYPGYQYDKSDFKNYQIVDFNDIKCKIYTNYDNILKVYYGDDYMVPKMTHDHTDFLENL